MLEKCVLTILELNWNQRLGNKKTKLNICHHMVASSTQLQNRSFHVVERTRMSSKCQKMKNARAKRAKILFFIVNYANLWGSCCRRRRGCLSSLLSLAFIYEHLVLPNELVRVELPQWKIWEADVSSVSYKSFALTFTNSFDKIKFSCFTLLTTQHHRCSLETRNLLAFV